MSKKILFVIVIIILIIAGISFAKKISNENETVKTTTNVVKNTENKVANTTKENKIEENNVDENTVEQENTEEANHPEERAKAIVMENWGEDDSVYYSYDGIDNEGRYIICVRDKNTTKALYFYYVDIETGTYDIE